MLNLITGTPGSGKTLYAVFLIDKQETQNKNNLQYNAKCFSENKKAIEQHELQHYFDSYTYFSKITKDYETVLFEHNHFDYFEQQERKTNIFLDITFYNGICEKIRQELDIKLKQLKFVRHQYANIDGLKVDNVKEIEIDWRKCPDGSVIFYDEIQLIDEYSNDNKRDEQHIIRDLTIHRHRAFDIYGITQFPRLVNVGFRDVVGLHYHLHRGWGAKAATVYVWANCRDKPNSIGNKFTAERDFKFNYPRHLYKVYESATADTVKLRIPTKFLLLLIIPFIGIMLFIYSVSNGGGFLATIFGSEKDKKTTQQQQTLNTKQQKTDEQQQASVDVASSSEVAQLKQQITELKSQLDSQNIDYDANKPFKTITYQYQAVSKPYFSGCIQLKNACECYSQQGSKLQVSISDCKRVMRDGQPFNPLKPDFQQQATRYDAVNVQTQQLSSSLPQQQQENTNNNNALQQQTQTTQDNQQQQKRNQQYIFDF